VGLGAALVTFGVRESGTGRLEEGGAAYLAALEEGIQIWVFTAWNKIPSATIGAEQRRAGCNNPSQPRRQPLSTIPNRIELGTAA
jgi:hypothetical protein